MFEDFEPLSKKEWLAKAEKDLKGKPLEKIYWHNFEGKKVAPFYTAEDSKNQSNTKLIPAQFPFIRGTKELSNGWLIRERIQAYKNITATRKRVENAINQGSHNILLQVEADKSGINGIPIHGAEQLAALLENVDNRETGISFSSGSASPFLFKLAVEWASSKSDSTLFGSIDYNPLGEALRSGTIHQSEDNWLDLLKKIFAIAEEKAPFYKLLSISSAPFHNSGGSLVQELAYTLALANEYIHKLNEKGIPIDDYYKHLQFELSTGSSYFQEIAKIRAFRWLWSTLSQEYSQNEDVSKAYILSHTSQWNKSVYDSHVNMLRLTTEAMSASIGGADELLIDSYDYGFRKSSDFSSRIARNVHHLMVHESHLDKSIDPGSGSYYVEELTQQLATDAWKLFKEIEEKGGFHHLAKSSWISNQLVQSRKKREERLALRKEKFVGVNEYPNPTDRITDLIEEGADALPHADDVQAKNLSEASSLSEFCKWAFSDNGENYEVLPEYMATEAFEQLRASVEMAAQEGEETPGFFIMPLGNKVMRSARANYALNFYQCAGFKVQNHLGFESVEQAVDAFVESPEENIIICSSDQEYETLIPQITKALVRKNKRPKLILAGKPGDKEEDYEDMGIQEFIYAGCNVYQVLKGYVENTMNPMM